jgi:hypothetical protein
VTGGDWAAVPASTRADSVGCWRVSSASLGIFASAPRGFNMSHTEAQRLAAMLNEYGEGAPVRRNQRIPVGLLRELRPGYKDRRDGRSRRPAPLPGLQAKRNEPTMQHRADEQRRQRAERLAQAEADRIGMKEAKATVAALRPPPEPLPTPGTEADTFRCGRTVCTLSGTACARRWADIDAKARRTRAGIAEVTAFQASLDKCHKCDAGRARADALGITRGKPELVRFIGTGPDHRNFAPPAGAS